MMNSEITLRTVTCLIFVLMMSVQSFSECPSICSCEWEIGKKTAECIGKGLTEIPSGLNPDTQLLKISENKFNEIPSQIFLQRGLINLQRIFLEDCGISKIASDAFFKLDNLVILNLRGNNLKNIPTEALQDCPNLRHLYLARNPIDQIDSGAFRSLSSLTTLGLAKCGIKHLQPGAFNGLGSIQYIELNDNQMTTLSVDVLKPLSNLREIHLYNNPWNCDCKLQEIILWATEHHIPFSTPPDCEAPSAVKGMSWTAMSSDDFVCLPATVPIPKETTVNTDYIVSITCRVDATPKATIYWEVPGKSLKNISSTPELQAKYSVETDDNASILTIHHAVASDGGTYVCVAENSAGTASTNFVLLLACPNVLH